MLIEKLQPGQTVWNVRRQKMGNTTISTVAIFPVRIVEVHPRVESDPRSGYVLAGLRREKLHQDFGESYYLRTERLICKTTIL